MASGMVQEFPIEEEYKRRGIKPEDIEKLRRWLETQPHLPAKYITDLDLILVYHSCNYSAEVAKQVLDLNFTLRTLLPNIFKGRRVDGKHLKSLDVVLGVLLETQAYDDSVVAYCRLIDYDVKKFVFVDALKAVFMILDLWQYETGTAPGFFILIDLGGMTFGHLARLEIVVLQQFLYYLQEAMFVKITGVHFLNAPPFIDKLMMLIKPFLKKEIMAVLHIHNIGSRTIEKFMPMDSLPENAGGRYKTFKQIREDTIAKLKENEEYFVEEEKKRVVESLRPGKQKTITDIFGGIEGSFKKLDID